VNPKEARTRKAERETARLRSVIGQALDAIRSNRGTKAYHLLNRALQDGAPPARTGEVGDVASIAEFDEGFRRLCLVTGYRAGYVVAVPDGTSQSGGDPAVTKAIDTAFAEAQSLRAADVGDGPLVPQEIQDPHGSEAKDQRERQE
jgi:hypothetical protein